MKKLILTLTALLILAPARSEVASGKSETHLPPPASFSEHVKDDNIALLTKKGFFETDVQAAYANPYIEVKKALCQHLRYANSYNLDGLKSLYADNYVNTDGLNKDIYIDLIKKTWESYPDIKYSIEIKNIDANEEQAVAQVVENAIASTSAKSGIIHERGILQSTSSSVYYMEKINNKWLITSDKILSEKTSLKYGVANDAKIDLIAPNQIPANTQYTAALDIQAPKDSLIIASIGKEEITYPQVLAEEIFRKLPEDGSLERVFKSNNKNINEYAVASFGITKARIINQSELKIFVTGLGFVMSRVNVIPKNEYVTIAKDTTEAQNDKDVKNAKIEKSLEDGKNQKNEQKK